MKISPVWALCVGLFFGGLFALQAWMGFKWREYQGPDFMAQDSQGYLYVTIKNKILRYNAKGAYVDERDLLSIGVHQLVGNIGFFPNGDLLMVPQDYNLTPIERFLVNYRITPQKNSSAASSQLSRCKWETLTCEKLPLFTESLRRAFWVYVDESENIFLADTTHHRLLWLSKDGALLDEYANKDELQFPNQLIRKGQDLWFANCNDNSISRINLKDKKFGSNLVRYKATDKEERWPTGLVWTGSEWVGLVQGDNLTNGSLYHINESEKQLVRFQQNEVGDFLSIGFFQNQILASDFRAVSIKRFDLQGNPLADFNSPQFEKIANDYRAAQRFWKRLELMAKVVFWVALVLGFGLALWLEKKHKRLQESNQIARAVDASLKRHIQWVKHKSRYRNLPKWRIWFMCGVLVLFFPALFSAEEESVLGASLALVVHGIILLTLIQTYRLFSIEIGAAVPWIYIRGVDKKADGSPNEDILHEKDLYSFSFLGQSTLMLGRHQIKVRSGRKVDLFEGKLANEYIDRLVSLATPMTIRDRVRWIFVNRQVETISYFLVAGAYALVVVVLFMVK